MGAFGALLGYLRARDGNLLHRVFWIMLTGWIGFTFFRDPFFISIVKSMFEFSFAVPLLIVIAIQMLSLALRATLRPPLPATEGR
jgi:hypothetical protein